MRDQESTTTGSSTCFSTVLRSFDAPRTPPEGLLTGGMPKSPFTGPANEFHLWRAHSSNSLWMRCFPELRGRAREFPSIWRSIHYLPRDEPDTQAIPLG